MVGACQVARIRATRRPKPMALYELAAVVAERFLPEPGLERIRSVCGHRREIVQRWKAEEAVGTADAAAVGIVAAVVMESAGTAAAAEVAEIAPAEVAGTALAGVAALIGIAAVAVVVVAVAGTAEVV